MTHKKLEYAKANIDIIAKENNIKSFISDNKLYIETIHGRNFQLSHEEITHQAIEYLTSEIEYIKTNF